MASKAAAKQNLGVWLFMSSNVSWAAWGIHAGAMESISLQGCLAAMNIRGAKKTAM